MSPGDAARKIEYGLFVICPKCATRQDIWTERCHCGTELLRDDRKIRLSKQGGAPAGRMVRRSARLEKAGGAADREQAVRDLAAVRRSPPAGTKNPTVEYGPGIVRNLAALGRLDEACVEAETLFAAGFVDHMGCVRDLVAALVDADDRRAEVWLRRATASGLHDAAGGRRFAGRYSVHAALVELLIRQGRTEEALVAFETAHGDLAARHKASAKRHSEAFAVGYYDDSWKALERASAAVVGAQATEAVRLGDAALAEADRLEQAGQRDAALSHLRTESARVQALDKRSQSLVRGRESKHAAAPIQGVSARLHERIRRLEKVIRRG